MGASASHPPETSPVGSDAGPSPLGALVCLGVHLLALTAFQLLVLRRASLALGQDYGAFAYLYAATSAAMAFPLTGLHATLMRFLAISVARRDPGQARALVLRCAAVRFGLLMVTGAGLAVFLRVTAPDLPAAVIVQAVLFVVVQGMALLGQAALQGLQWYPALAASSLSTLAALLFVPGTDLAGLLAMLSVGYLASCLVMSGVLVAGLGRAPAEAAAADTDVGELVRFSIVASAAAFFMQLADNAPVLLLRDAYAPAVYGALGLAFNLAAYPSRVNALTDAFLLPRLSTALHHERPARAASIFLGSVEAMQLAGPLLLVPVVIALGPIVRWFFAPELHAAVLPAAILIAANLPRMLMPVSKAVLFAHGLPGRFVLVTAMKLAVDVVTVVLLAGRRPEVLAAALVASWVVYANALDVGARAELDLAPGIDWPTLASVTVVVGALVVGAERWLLVPLWVAALVLTLRRGRRLAAMVA